jgi:DNA-directed RNA polymerase subunit RPC12/RpoP
LIVSQDDTMSAPASGPTFRFRCSRCASVLEAPVAQAGGQARCPSCDAVFVVPQVNPMTGLALGGADPGDDGQYPAPVHAYAAAGHAAPRIIRLPDDSLVIECPNCRQRTDIKADNCPTCGRPFTLEGSAASPNPQSGDNNVLVLGIISLPLLLLCGIGAVVGLVAVIYGLSTLRSRPGDRRNREVTAGVILGALSCLIGLGVILIELFV